MKRYQVLCKKLWNLIDEESWMIKNPKTWNKLKAEYGFQEDDDIENNFIVIFGEHVGLCFEDGKDVKRVFIPNCSIEYLDETETREMIETLNWLLENIQTED